MDIDQLIEKTLTCKTLSELEIYKICRKVAEILAKEPNVKKLSTPITLVGDVHGQFFDVLELFKVGGPVGDIQYLFLGDYVDRGRHSVETITLLFLYKIKYPDRITLIRGNHETREISQSHGFFEECSYKFGRTSNVWKYFTDAFDYLTITCLIDDKIFCTHGGISPSLYSLDQLELVDRVNDNQPESMISDLMWSDPDENLEGFKYSVRGEGFYFGEKVLDQFLQYNGLECICRAHQLCQKGYAQYWKEKCNTVWSAPNYVYRMGNLASICEIDTKRKLNFKMFDPSIESTPAQKESKMSYFL